jgi:hypothetical protein
MADKRAAQQQRRPSFRTGQASRQTTPSIRESEARPERLQHLKQRPRAGYAPGAPAATVFSTSQYNQFELRSRVLAAFAA